MSEPEDSAKGPPVTPAAPAQDPAFPIPPALQRGMDGFDHKFRNKLAEPREKIAHAIEEVTQGKVKASLVEKIAPTAGAIGATALLLTFYEQVTKVGSGTLKAVSGFFRKLGVIGLPVAVTLEAVGELTGVIATGVAAAITFKALQKNDVPNPPGDLEANRNQGGPITAGLSASGRGPAETDAKTGKKFRTGEVDVKLNEYERGLKIDRTTIRRAFDDAVENAKKTTGKETVQYRFKGTKADASLIEKAARLRSQVKSVGVMGRRAKLIYEIPPEFNVAFEEFVTQGKPLPGNFYIVERLANPLKRMWRGESTDTRLLRNDNNEWNKALETLIESDASTDLKEARTAARTAREGVPAEGKSEPVKETTTETPPEPAKEAAPKTEPAPATTEPAPPKAEPAPTVPPKAETAPVEPPRARTTEYTPEAVRTVEAAAAAEARKGTAVERAQAKSGRRMLPESVGPWNTLLEIQFQQAIGEITRGTDVAAQQALVNLSPEDIIQIQQKMVETHSTSWKDYIRLIKETHAKGEARHAEHTAQLEQLTNEETELRKQAAEEFTRETALREQAALEPDKATELNDRAQQAQNKAHELIEKAEGIKDQIEERTTGKKVVKPAPAPAATAPPEADAPAVEGNTVPTPEEWVQRNLDYMKEKLNLKEAAEALTDADIAEATEAWRQRVQNRVPGEKLDSKTEYEFVRKLLEQRGRERLHASEEAAKAGKAPTEAPATEGKGSKDAAGKPKAEGAGFHGTQVMHGVLAGALLFDGGAKIFKSATGIDKVEDIDKNGGVVCDYEEAGVHYRLKMRDAKEGEGWITTVLNCDAYTVDAKGHETKVEGVTKQVRIVDRKGYLGSLATGTLEFTGGGMMLGGAHASGLKGASLMEGKWGKFSKAENLGKWGGRFFIAAHVGEKALEGYGDMTNGDAGAGGAKLGGAAFDGVVWTFAGPAGIVMGTAPGKFVEIMQEKWAKGEPMTDKDMLDLFEATLPGTLVVQPIHEIDNEFTKVMAALPEDQRKVWLMNEKGKPVALTRENLHELYPHLNIMLTQAANSTTAPATPEDLAKKHQELVADPIAAWIKIYNHEIGNYGRNTGGILNYTPLEDTPKGRERAMEELKKYAGKTISDVRPSSAAAWVQSWGNYGWNNFAGSGLEKANIDWSLALTATQMQDYLHEVAPHQDNLFRGAGRAPRPPVLLGIAPAAGAMLGLPAPNVPQAQADTQPAPDASQVPPQLQPSLTEVKTSQYVAAARELLQNRSQDIKELEQYRDLMAWESQRAADTKEFVKAARTWGESPQDEQQKAIVARVALAEAYKRHKFLNDKEIDALLPKAPDVSLTVFTGNGPHGDGFDFPKPLLAFGEKMQKHYGLGFQYKPGIASSQKPFAQMANEEKLDFLHQAMAYYESRMNKYEGMVNGVDITTVKKTPYKKVNELGGGDQETVTAHKEDLDITLRYSYLDHDNDRRGFFEGGSLPEGTVTICTDVVGQTRMEKWSDEHQFLRDDVFQEIVKIGPEYKKVLLSDADRAARLLEGDDIKIRELPSSRPNGSPATIKVTAEENLHDRIEHILGFGSEDQGSYPNFDWGQTRARAGMRTMLQNELRDMDLSIPSYQRYLHKQANDPNGTIKQYQRGVNVMGASQQMMQRGVILIAADTVNGGTDPHGDNGYRPEGSWMLFKERNKKGDDHYYYASGSWEGTGKERFVVKSFIDAETGIPKEISSKEPVVIDLSKTGKNEAVSSFAHAFQNFRGLVPADRANEYAFDLQEKLKLAACEVVDVKLRNPKEMSDGDLITLHCKDALSSCEYTMTVKCTKTGEDFIMVPQSAETKLPQKHGGEVIKVDCTTCPDDPKKVHDYILAQQHLADVTALSKQMQDYIKTTPEELVGNKAAETFVDVSQELKNKHQLVLISSDRFKNSADATNAAPPPHKAGWIAFKDARDDQVYYAEGRWEKYKGQGETEARHDIFVVSELINQKTGARIKPAQNIALDMSGNTEEKTVRVPSGDGKSEIAVSTGSLPFLGEVINLKAHTPEQRYNDMRPTMKDTALYKSAHPTAGLVLPAYAAVQGDKALAPGQKAVIPDCHDEDTNLHFALKGQWTVRPDGQFVLQPESAAITMPDKSIVEVPANPNEALHDFRERLLIQYLGKLSHEQRVDHLIDLDGKRYTQVLISDDGKMVAPAERVHQSHQVKEVAAKALLQQKLTEMAADKATFQILGFHGGNAAELHPLVSASDEKHVTIDMNQAEIHGSGGEARMSKNYDPDTLLRLKKAEWAKLYDQARGAPHNSRVSIELKTMSADDIDHMVKLGTIAGMDIKKGAGKIIDISTQDLQVLLPPETMKRVAFPALVTTLRAPAADLNPLVKIGKAAGVEVKSTAANQGRGMTLSITDLEKMVVAAAQKNPAYNTTMAANPELAKVPSVQRLILLGKLAGIEIGQSQTSQGPTIAPKDLEKLIAGYASGHEMSVPLPNDTLPLKVDSVVPANPKDTKIEIRDAMNPAVAPIIYTETSLLTKDGAQLASPKTPTVTASADRPVAPPK